MQLSIDLEYTPCSPPPTGPFTEKTFVRTCSPWTCQIEEIGLVLVDLWNIGWEDGPVHPPLGPELSLERGRSHAERKRAITQQVIGPTVETLRRHNVQIFHANHPPMLERYPQWMESTTEKERHAVERKKTIASQVMSDQAETQNV